MTLRDLLISAGTALPFVAAIIVLLFRGRNFGVSEALAIRAEIQSIADRQERRTEGILRRQAAGFVRKRISPEFRRQTKENSKMLIFQMLRQDATQLLQAAGLDGNRKNCERIIGIILGRIKGSGYNDAATFEVVFNGILQSPTDVLGNYTVNLIVVTEATKRADFDPFRHEVYKQDEVPLA